MTQDRVDDAAITTAQEMIGIAQGTIEGLIAFLREQEQDAEDPLLLREVADLEIRLHAAEAVLVRAVGLAADPGVKAASILAAEAEVLATEIALVSSARFFELSGRSLSQDAIHPGDRRTPLRWQVHAIGNLVVNGVLPPHDRRS